MTGFIGLDQAILVLYFSLWFRATPTVNQNAPKCLDRAVRTFFVLQRHASNVRGLVRTSKFPQSRIKPGGAFEGVRTVLLAHCKLDHMSS